MNRTLVFTALLLLAGCAAGPSPPQITGTVRTPVNARVVRLFLPECVPAGHQTIARLDASELASSPNSEVFNMSLIRKLREQAAGLGANALEVTPVTHAATINPARRVPAFAVSAIWVPHAVGSAVAVDPDSQLPWARACTNTAYRLRYEILHGYAPGMNPFAQTPGLGDRSMLPSPMAHSVMRPLGSSAPLPRGS